MQHRRPRFHPWVRKICWRRDRLPTLVFLGFPGGSAGKESCYNAGDLGSIPGLGRFPWRRERQTESFGKHNCGNNAPSTMSRHRKLYAERGLESVTVLALLILSRGWGGGASFKNEKLVLKKRLALFIFFVK